MKSQKVHKTSRRLDYRAFGAFEGTRPYLYVMVLVLFFTMLYSALTFLRAAGDTTLWDAFFQEDMIIENITFLLFLGASLLFFKAGLCRNVSKRRRFFLFALGVVLFVVAMEEISWGQRVFGWETTDWFSSGNRQRETNLHNFNDTIAHSLLWGGTLLIGVLTPLAFHILEPARKMMEKLHFPTASADLHFFFLLPFVYHYGKFSVHLKIVVTMAALALLFLSLRSPKLKGYRRELPPTWGVWLPLLLVLMGVLLYIVHSTTIGISNNTQAQEAGELLFGLAFFIYAWSKSRKKLIMPRRA